MLTFTQSREDHTAESRAESVEALGEISLRCNFFPSIKRESILLFKGGPNSMSFVDAVCPLPEPLFLRTGSVGRRL